MNTIQPIDNDSDCVPLYLPHSLFLKPFARINVSVSLPASVTGKLISNFDIMEKLRFMIQPEKFAVLKVTKSTIEFIRFEGELENAKEAPGIMERLDGRNIKLANFTELIKVRASLAKDTFPTRHAWDSFFRDARDMDEMKPGERPDTVHLSNLPIRWFCPRHQEMDENVRPSESIFKRIFEKFGQVRAVDIPICDPYRKEMKSQMSGMHTFSHDQEQYFDGFVQFEEYLGFTETMRALRNMKLVRKEKKSFAINIVVDFDRTKHLSDSNVKRRTIVRERCVAKEQAREEEVKKKRAAELAKLEQDRKQEEAKRQLVLDQQAERENRRKEKQLLKLRNKEQIDISSKILAEEKKLMLAQRKLEGIRVLEALFERIKIKAPHKAAIKKEPKMSYKENGAVVKGDLRNKLVTRVKVSQEEEFERQKSRLMMAKSSGLLGAVLKAGARSPSGSSISSDDSVLSDSRQKKKKKKKNLKKKKKKNGDASSSESSGLSEEEPRMPLLGHHPPGAFPIFNPETGQWMSMNMYHPYGNPFFPSGPIAARSEYFPPSLGYRGGAAGPPVYRGGPRGRFTRGGGRGGVRGGRVGYQSYEMEGSYNNKIEEGQDYRRERYSRSRSNSRGRRSYSRSRSRRPRSRSRRSRSKSKQKLVSTLRKSNSSTRWSSRSRSASRGKSRRSWSRKSSTSRSRSRHRRHRSRSSSARNRSNRRSRTRSKSRPKSPRDRTRSRSKSRARSRSKTQKKRSRSRSNPPNETKRGRSSSSRNRNKSTEKPRSDRGATEEIETKQPDEKSIDDRNRSDSRRSDTRERKRSSERDVKRRDSNDRQRSHSSRDRKPTNSREHRRSSSRNGKRTSSRTRERNDSHNREQKRSHVVEGKRSTSRATSAGSNSASNRRRQGSSPEKNSQ